MTIARARRLVRALAFPAALLVAVGLAAVAGRDLARAATAPRPGAPLVRGLAVSRTNTELLVTAARAVAARLAVLVPLGAGTRVALQAEGHDAIDTDVSEALLLALNARGFTCVLLTPAVAESTAAAAVAPPDTAGAPAASATLGAKAEYLRLQEERRQQAARADSMAQLAARAAAAHALAPMDAGLPVLSYRVAEGRVDYVRLLRSGIFGGERVERRATTRITLKLHAPGDDAVRWSTSADTTIGDVVGKGELASLEDRMRPETRPTPPSSNLKKVVEPALVVALIAGLVSLFYQNRP